MVYDVHQKIVVTTIGGETLGTQTGDLVQHWLRYQVILEMMLRYGQVLIQEWRVMLEITF